MPRIAMPLPQPTPRPYHGCLPTMLTYVSTHDSFLNDHADVVELLDMLSQS